MDLLITNVTGGLIVCIQVISIILITLGVFTTLYNLTIKTVFGRDWNYYIQTRLVLSRFLLLALEFQIAGDILETVLKPGWEEFGQLAATIVIRSVLSYVLILETKSQT